MSALITVKPVAVEGTLRTSTREEVGAAIGVHRNTVSRIHKALYFGLSEYRNQTGRRDGPILTPQRRVIEYLARQGAIGLPIDTLTHYIQQNQHRLIEVMK